MLAIDDAVSRFKIAYCSAVGRKIGLLFGILTLLASRTLGVQVGGKSGCDTACESLCASALNVDSVSLYLASCTFFCQSNSSRRVLSRFPLVKVGCSESSIDENVLGKGVSSL